MAKSNKSSNGGKTKKPTQKSSGKGKTDIVKKVKEALQLMLKPNNRIKIVKILKILIEDLEDGSKKRSLKGTYKKTSGSE
jgi:hypothetical protein